MASHQIVAGQVIKKNNEEIKIRTHSMSTENTHYKTPSYLSPHSLPNESEEPVNIITLEDTEKMEERLKQEKKSERYSISSHSPVMKWWDLWLVSLLIYVTFLTPYEMAFLQTVKWDAIFSINRVVDFFFICDIGISFFLQYYDPKRGHFVKDHRTIMWHYLKTSFVIDFLATIPYDWFVPDANNEDNDISSFFRYLRLLRCLKLLRLVRVTRIVTRWQADFGVSHSVTGLFYLFLGMLIISHWGACIWGMLPILVEDTSWMDSYGIADGTAFQKYLASFYWSIMTLTTIGYGDVSPQNDEERIIAMIFMYIGGVMYAYIVGAICNIVAGMNSALHDFQCMMDNLNQYMQEMDIDNEHRIEMRSYFLKNQSRFKHNHHMLVLDLMSPGLSKQFSSFCNKEWMKKLKFWLMPENGNWKSELDMFSSSIIQCLQLESFPAKEHMVESHERASKMYVIRRGLMAIRGKRRNGKGNIMRKDDVIGEDLILNLIANDPRRNYSVFCVTFCDVYSLSKKALLDVFQFGEFPHIGRQTRRAAIKKALINEAWARLDRETEAKSSKKTIVTPDSRSRSSQVKDENTGLKSDNSELSVVDLTNRLEQFIDVMKQIKISEVD